MPGVKYRGTVLSHISQAKTHSALDLIVRHGIGIVAGDKMYRACCCVAYISEKSPGRYAKVRDYQNRRTGYARLVRWVEQLKLGRELANGPTTPFRVVVLENDYSTPLLDYLAESEHSLGDIDILTVEEITAIANTFDHHPDEEGLTAEFVARLSIERRDFGEWAEELGMIQE